MGQKTHPTGFRIGVNKSHDATWFANYGAYSQILKEDHQIRKFFEKEWGLLYTKAGISKLEIKRKVNQLELLIHAARPKAIVTSPDDEHTFTTLRTQIKKLTSNQKQIRIKVIQVNKMETESTLVARALAEQLEKRVAFKRAMRQISQRLQKSGTKGFKLQVSGRLNGAEMARDEWLREGRVPLQTLRADISYATARAYTTYGVIGIKVWIFNKEII
uniref:Small ribosomal subunit protein uS3c n=2 Tax=Isochrysidaceae TaxID=418951 RepID=A0A3S6R2U7_9EUKA|nr:ribosomal protein S3 [Tisochrysis lutea]YP_009873635.1 ribosomal protein S3 [Isochrysis galbana]AUM82544.1 ribosomal protein S3 [Tisochrysis lutea]QKW88518.1 ribosomal protein S3 [Isochrysis galbana]